MAAVLDEQTATKVIRQVTVIIYSYNLPVCLLSPFYCFDLLDSHLVYLSVMGLGSRLCKQVEFYFSDSNLPRDNFLKKCIEESEDESIL